MILYFLRHGDAEQIAGIRDQDRKLTEKGITRTHNAAKVLATLAIQPTHIFSSPRVRARQTAEIVASALNQTVEIREELDFDFNLAALRPLLNGMAANAEVMLVGHNPSMSEVVSELTGAQIDMKKGGLARIDLMSASTGELIWLIAPKVFDAIVPG